MDNLWNIVRKSTLTQAARQGLSARIKFANANMILNPPGSIGFPFITFWIQPAILSSPTQSMWNRFGARKQTSGTPNGLPTSLSTVLSPRVLSPRRIFDNFEIWCAIVGNSLTLQLVRKTGHKTALLYLTLNWTMCSRMCLATLPPQSRPEFWKTPRRKIGCFRRENWAERLLTLDERMFICEMRY